VISSAQREELHFSTWFIWTNIPGLVLGGPSCISLLFSLGYYLRSSVFPVISASGGTYCKIIDENARERVREREKEGGREGERGGERERGRGGRERERERETHYDRE
jgi:hypothetical protein